MKIPELKLNAKQGRRLTQGHPWIFSNQISEGLKDTEPGQMVDIKDAKGRFIGRGLVNPHSLIAVRLYSTARDDLDQPSFYAARMRSALRHRERALSDRTSMRLIHAEGDAIPGLVVDRFGDTLSVQITTVGLQQRKEILQKALIEVFSPRGAVLRSEGINRRLEGLEDEREVWFGDPQTAIEINEYGLKFEVNPLSGQKTGHFYDQALNRFTVGKLAKGGTVLDAYSNGGGFALHAMLAGATEATTIEKSKEACGRIARNAEINGLPLNIIQGEAKKTMERMLAEGHRYNTVILDPPAFAKSRKNAGSALRGYRQINTLGLALTQPGGVFVTCSCSFHIQEDRFLDEVVKAAEAADRKLRVIHRMEQAPCHPVIPTIPETRYLKAWAFSVEMASGL